MDTSAERVTIQNTYPYALTICLEPWGEEIQIAAGATYVIERR
jgi:hypothetical protein